MDMFISVTLLILLLSSLYFGFREITQPVRSATAPNVPEVTVEVEIPETYITTLLAEDESPLPPVQPTVWNISEFFDGIFDFALAGGEFVFNTPEDYTAFKNLVAILPRPEGYSVIIPAPLMNEAGQLTIPMYIIQGETIAPRKAS